MGAVGLPHILMLAAVLFSTGLFGVLSSAHDEGRSRGVFLMFIAATVGLIGFAAFMPQYVVRSWEGMAGAILVLGIGILYSIRAVR